MHKKSSFTALHSQGGGAPLPKNHIIVFAFSPFCVCVPLDPPTPYTIFWIFWPKPRFSRSPDLAASIGIKISGFRAFPTHFVTKTCFLTVN